MIESYVDKISQRLIEVRKLIGKYQADIAKEYSDYSELEVNQSIISNYESGKLRVASFYLCFLAEKYNVNANYILTGQGSVWIEKSHDTVLVKKSEFTEMERNLKILENGLNRMRRGY